MVLNLLRRLKQRSLGAISMQFYQLATHCLWMLKGGRVHYGPFKGLILCKGHVFGAPAAKILGTYELELHDTLEKFRQTKPSLVVNIGGGEGYYACGIAKYWGIDELVVFETLEYGRRLINDNAYQNQVLNYIKIFAECSESDLFNLLNSQGADVLLIDAEGAELDLLSARILPLLSKVHVLIECHDFLRAGCANILAGYFSKTHDVELIETRERTCNDFPLCAPLPCATKIRLLGEGRPKTMTWLVGYSRERGRQAMGSNPRSLHE